MMGGQHCLRALLIHKDTKQRRFYEEVKKV